MAQLLRPALLTSFPAAVICSDIPAADTVVPASNNYVLMCRDSSRNTLLRRRRSCRSTLIAASNRDVDILNDTAAVDNVDFYDSSCYSDVSDGHLEQCKQKQQQQQQQQRRSVMENFRYSFLRASAAGALICTLHLLTANPVEAADPVQIYNCLIDGCRVELARCIADPSCAANLTCLETCNNRPDEAECEMRCGDLFGNSTVDDFNACAVSKKKCVPQKPDDGTFPVPQSCALVQKFDPVEFSGKWYISSGLNPTFDTYDCQIQEFSAPSPQKLTVQMVWRISTLDGGFFTRSTVQNLVQDPTHPGILYNHGNELLNYEDDWYILSAQLENKEDDYVFVYYKGRNDAWNGYGGAVVYTRSQSLPPSIVPQLTVAAEKVGLDFAKFQNTDNSCRPELPLLVRLEKKVQEGMLKLTEEAITKASKFEFMALLDKLKLGVLQELRHEQKAFLSFLNIRSGRD